jgi:hypothetical protein
MKLPPPGGCEFWYARQSYKLEIVGSNPTRRTAIYRIYRYTIHMEKCPKCAFKKVHDRVIRDPKTERVVEVSSVCGNCGHVLRTTTYEEKK